MAVVVGEYDPLKGQAELPEAKKEGNELVQRKIAYWVKANSYEVENLLHNNLTDSKGGKVVPQAVHFACHGQPGGVVLNDSSIVIDESIIQGTSMTQENRPFVFINACQVGLSSISLDEYGGLAQAFIKEGCKGFVAPLWSVNDKIAHEMAVDFYKFTLEEHNTVAEALCKLRSKFENTGQANSTYLAYIFFGHPDLLLNVRD
jgi:CHAT domain-containing protein